MTEKASDDKFSDVRSVRTPISHTHHSVEEEKGGKFWEERENG